MSSSAHDIVPYNPREILERATADQYKNLNAKTLKEWISLIHLPLPTALPKLSRQDQRIKYILKVRDSIIDVFPIGRISDYSLNQNWMNGIEDNRLLALAQIAAATMETRDSIIKSLQRYKLFKQCPPCNFDGVNTN